MATDIQWVKPQSDKPPKVLPKPVVTPTPSCNSPTDFPSLSNKNDPKGKKSSSVSLPISGAWSNDSKESKARNKKKNKSKNNNVGGEASASIKVLDTGGFINNPNNKNIIVNNKTQQNGVVKKRSELKIDSLLLTENGAKNNNDFPPLGTKLPPGISTHPPPGFAANDLTFTSSSGQSYSILPSHQFVPPLNFAQRNRVLIEKFMQALLQSSDEIYKFKQLSNKFRSGDIPPREYYEHCKRVMGSDFASVFPELLVLLPDINRQQELYTHHILAGGSTHKIEVCVTCKQVVALADLRTHLENHTLENNFPVLGAQDISSVWRK